MRKGGIPVKLCMYGCHRPEEVMEGVYDLVVQRGDGRRVGRARELAHIHMLAQL